VSVADRDGSVVFRFTPDSGPPERRVFVPRLGSGWTRHDQVWTGCRWQTRGVEKIRGLTVSGSPDATD
jgi:hypothetical protein